MSGKFVLKLRMHKATGRYSPFLALAQFGQGALALQAVQKLANPDVGENVLIDVSEEPILAARARKPVDGVIIKHTGSSRDLEEKTPVGARPASTSAQIVHTSRIVAGG